MAKQLRKLTRAAVVHTGRAANHTGHVEGARARWLGAYRSGNVCRTVNPHIGQSVEDFFAELGVLDEIKRRALNIGAIMRQPADGDV